MAVLRGEVVEPKVERDVGDGSWSCGDEHLIKRETAGMERWRGWCHAVFHGPTCTADVSTLIDSASWREYMSP